MAEIPSIFTGPVAEVACDILDRRRHRDDPGPRAEVGIDVDLGLAGGIVVARWTERIAACVDGVALMRELIRNDATDRGSGSRRDSLNAVREELLKLEEALSTTLDEHHEAVWVSLPRARRVQRLRDMRDEMHRLRAMSERALGFEARSNSAEELVRLQRSFEERSLMDPDAATLACEEPSVPENGSTAGWCEAKPGAW